MSEQNEVAIKRIHKTVLLFFCLPADAAASD